MAQNSVQIRKKYFSVTYRTSQEKGEVILPSAIDIALWFHGKKVKGSGIRLE